MPNRSKQKGDRWERECRSICEAMGADVYPTKGSKTCFDFIAIFTNYIWIVQARCNVWFHGIADRLRMEATNDGGGIKMIWRKDDWNYKKKIRLYNRPAPRIKWFDGVWQDADLIATDAQCARAQLRKGK